MSLQIRRFLCLLTLAAAAVGCYWSVRLGRADWLAGQATVSAASESIELAPGNSAYLRHGAEIREAEGLSASGLRERAARINPLDSDNWIRVAIQAEMEGRSGEAEQKLLRAFEVDHQFEPRWALASFYFREGNPELSLDWARKTLEFGGGDLTAVFQLCWTVSGKGGEILDKAIPHRVEVLAQYLLFLDGSGRVDEAGDVAKVLLPLASADQVPVLVAHCSKSLEAGKAEAAMAVWNGLIGRGLIAGERVEPGAGRPSVDTGFQREMTGQGFEWGVQRVDGVAVERRRDRRGVRVVFSRVEPEQLHHPGTMDRSVIRQDLSISCRIRRLGHGWSGSEVGDLLAPESSSSDVGCAHEGRFGIDARSRRGSIHWRAGNWRGWN
jgi:tetratricopeptide (TPR) repeat protein